jgi:hypothetical protein
MDNPSKKESNEKRLIKKNNFEASIIYLQKCLARYVSSNRFKNTVVIGTWGQNQVIQNRQKSQGAFYVLCYVSYEIFSLIEW